MTSRVLPFLIFLAAASAAMAQSGAVKGTIRDSATSTPVIGAVVRLVSADGEGRSLGGRTDSDGNFNITGVPDGAYRLEITSIGYASVEPTPITVRGGSTVSHNATLRSRDVRLDNVIVTASRKKEKALDAPASVWVADARTVGQATAVTPHDHLRGVAGVDIAQKGVQQTEVVARGFNNVFSGSLMTLSDGRIAGVPSLRVNVPYLIPVVNDDIERIELVRGPGSALYGPNAASGVLNIITKSPFAHPGTSVQLTGGTQDLLHGALRHAGTLGSHIGYKITGQYFRAEDWPYVDSIEVQNRNSAIAAGRDTSIIGVRDPIAERFGGEARLDFMIDENTTANIAYGMNQAVRNIELTDLGAAQVRNWRYSYLQARADIGRLSVQAFMNNSDAGETYLIRAGDTIVDRSMQVVSRVQHSFELSDMQEFTYGGDMFLTRPNTDSTITGRNENDDDINEFGGYLQSETKLLDRRLTLLLAGRIDYNNRVADPIFSPRAALAYKPTDDQQVRLTLNRAYTTPTTNDLFLDLVSSNNVFGFPDQFRTAIRASGVPSTGYSFARGEMGLTFHSPFTDRNTAIPVVAAANLWQAATGFVIAGIQADTTLTAQQKGLATNFLSGLPAPNPTQVGGVMALLNSQTRQFEPVTDAFDIPALVPTTTQTLELGYKGVITDAVELGLDVYWTHIENFIGPLQVFTPNVFLNGTQAAAYMTPLMIGALRAQGMDSATATVTAAVFAPRLASAYARIPLGTVTPEGVTDPTALVLAVRNYGTVNVGGLDLSADVRINNMFSVGATASLTDREIFAGEDDADVPMNSPDFKASISARYRDEELGLRAETRFRYVDGFSMSSGVYEADIPSYGVLDLAVGYRMPFSSNLDFVINATNVLGNEHIEFVGSPAIGRMITARASYSF